MGLVPPRSFGNEVVGPALEDAHLSYCVDLGLCRWARWRLHDGFGAQADIGTGTSKYNSTAIRPIWGAGFGLALTLSTRMEKASKNCFHSISEGDGLAKVD